MDTKKQQVSKIMDELPKYFESQLGYPGWMFEDTAQELKVMLFRILDGETLKFKTKD